jgi:enoyl-CoA hydratase/carnithine racemase
MSDVNPMYKIIDLLIRFTLQSEGTLNALTVEMGQEFANTVREISHNVTTGKEKVDVVVLTGAGDTAFSAGGDLGWLRSLRNSTEHANADLMLQFYKSFLCIRSKIHVSLIRTWCGMISLSVQSS